MLRWKYLLWFSRVPSPSNLPDCSSRGWNPLLRSEMKVAKADVQKPSKQFEVSCEWIRHKWKWVGSVANAANDSRIWAGKLNVVSEAVSDVCFSVSLSDVFHVLCACKTFFFLSPKRSWEQLLLVFDVAGSPRVCVHKFNVQVVFKQCQHRFFFLSGFSTWVFQQFLLVFCESTNGICNICDSCKDDTQPHQCIHFNASATCGCVVLREGFGRFHF